MSITMVWIYIRRLRGWRMLFRRSPPTTGVPSSRLEETPWRMRLNARLPPLGSRVLVMVTPCGFRGRRKEVWVGFSGFLPFSPATKFISLFIDTHLINFATFHFIHSCEGASGVVGRHPCSLKTFKYREFIESHLST